MVFSGNTSNESGTATSPYGIINVNINPKPLIQGTTVREYILFDVKVEIFNCIRAVLQELLNTLELEILNKVDTILTPLNGQVDDGQSGNYFYPTVGLGVVNLKVQPTLLVSGTNNLDEIVFGVELQLVNCNRPRLVNILNGLNLQIMDKVNDVL